MDAATQRRNLIAFYFGTEVAVGDIASNRVVDKVARRAYADLRRAIHRFGTHPAKDTIKEVLLQTRVFDENGGSGTSVALHTNK